jgi:small subunit ribosomal protein S18
MSPCIARLGGAYPTAWGPHSIAQQCKRGPKTPEVPQSLSGNYSSVTTFVEIRYMRFVKRRPKSRSYQVPRVIAIAQKRSKSNSPAFQGTIDYKNIVLLRKFITAEGKILPRRNSHLTAKQQRYMARAIKNARLMGLLPFINKNQSPAT